MLLAAFASVRKCFAEHRRGRIQPDVELALQRAMRRVDSILKQYARRRVLAL
jgi:hypothetical protein